MPSSASYPGSTISEGPTAPQAIGNYKGVMLCNRPGVVAEIPEWVKPTRDGLPVFRAGVPQEVVHPRGRHCGTDIDYSSKVRPHKRRHDAIEAHRSWLSALVSRRAALQVGQLLHHARSGRIARVTSVFAFRLNAMLKSSEGQRRTVESPSSKRRSAIS